MSIFDGTVISGDVGLHKPEPAIYELGAERIGLEPAACIFVDDLRENVAGAEAVGHDRVLHRDPATTIAELERPPRRRPRPLVLQELFLDHRSAVAGRASGRSPARS